MAATLTEVVISYSWTSKKTHSNTQQIGRLWTKVFALYFPSAGNQKNMAKYEASIAL